VSGEKNKGAKKKISGKNPALLPYNTQGASDKGSWGRL